MKDSCQTNEPERIMQNEVGFEVPLECAQYQGGDIETTTMEELLTTTEHESNMVLQSDIIQGTLAGTDHCETTDIPSERIKLSINRPIHECRSL